MESKRKRMECYTVSKVFFSVALCIIMVIIVGCGTSQATSMQPQYQNNQSTLVSAAETKSRSTQTDQTIRLVVIEKTIKDVKSYNYYADLIPKLYLNKLEESVKNADGFDLVAGYLDADWPIYEAEKKIVEECFAKGIKLRLIASSFSASTPQKGRTLKKGGDYQLYEFKVFVKYSMEFIYADNRKEIHNIQKIFTVRQKQEVPQGANQGAYVQKITVVITNIEDKAGE